MIKKRKYKLKILFALIALVVACLALAACDNTFKPEENGYSAIVTYDANGGRFGNSDNTGIKVYKYAPGAKIIQPGGTQTSQVVAPILTEKHVSDWYPAILDGDGNVVRDDDGNIKVSDTPWNFSIDKLPDTEGYKLYLVAHWVGNFTFTVDVGEEARADGVSNIVNSNYDRPGTASRPAITPTWEGHTFYRYCDGDGKTIETDSDWRKIEISEANPNAVVYAEWIEGDWTIVRSAKDMSSITGALNYYVDADIDFAGTTISGGDYIGEFNGNGHTISNFKCDISVRGVNQSDLGLFRFGAAGKMHDVVFENCSVSFDLYSGHKDKGFNIGFLCGNGEALDMANFKNIGFVGCTLKITRRLDAVGITVNTGAGTDYSGIFGKLGPEQTFKPVEGKAEVTTEIEDK